MRSVFGVGPDLGQQMTSSKSRVGDTKDNAKRQREEYGKIPSYAMGEEHQVKEGRKVLNRMQNLQMSFWRMPSFI